MSFRIACPAVVLSLVLSCLGGATAESLIRFDKKVLETAFYAEGAAIGDVNGDGKMDVVYGPFWFEGPGFEKRHTIYPAKAFNINGYSDNFFSFVEDLNKDGAADVLVLGFPGKEARLYVNPGKDKVAEVKEWPVFVVAEVVDNESPDFVDVDGDGVKEIVCSKEGQFGFYKRGADVTKAWDWVAISDNVGVQKFTHGLGVGDVDGDGKMDLLEAKRWWQAPAKVGEKWVPRTFQLAGSGGAQMFAYDFNGDGRNDIMTSLNAHQFGVAMFENLGGKDGANWRKQLIVGKEPWENEYGVRFSQPHALTLADVDGDGVKDLITGKRYWAHNGKDPNELDPKVLYWFQTKRGKDGAVEFVPHLIDGDTGVGTQVVAGDVNGDGLVDVVVGNKHGLRVLTQRREEVSVEKLAQFQPKKFYGEGSIKTGDYVHGQTAQDLVKNMVLPAGFKAELVASEPDLVQPIAFCWDERGRIWVLEGNTYPTRAPEGQGKDRILIFEDADGDGKFETRKVFLEGLNLTSGIEVGFGGVWVGAAPNFLFIPDKDKDDKPDGEPVVLLDGWGYQDTHETLNSFIWGPDGWLYGCHGVFTHSKVGKPGTPEAERERLNAAVWRYHPTRHVFEVFAHGTSNPWGLDFNEKGEFFTTACVIPHLYHIVPGGRYQRQAGQHFNEHTYDDIKTIAGHVHYAGGWTEVRNREKMSASTAANTDQAGGGHAHCGLAIYNGGAFPEVYDGALLFGNLHGHRLVHNAVEPKGSGYVGERRADFMRSNDMWFIPVTQKVGPDGALYVSDWADKQVCHQVDPLVWDRENGRIFRVVYDEVKPWKGDLGKLSDEELVKMAIESENEWFARMARRVLMERAAEGKLSGFSQEDEYRLFRSVTEAMVDEDVATSARGNFVVLSIGGLGTGSDWRDHFHSSKDWVRAWGVRAVGNTRGAGGFALETDGLSHLMYVNRMAKEEKSPWVRRELASLLQRLPLDKRAEIAKALLVREEDGADHNIPLLVWYGIEPLVGQNPELGMELAKLCVWDKVKGFIYRRMAASEKGRAVLLAGIAAMEDAGQRESMLQLMVNNARGSGDIKQPDGWAEMVVKLREGASPVMTESVDELSAYFGDEDSVAKFRKVLVDAKVGVAAREIALSILIKVRDRQTAPLLQGLIADQAKEALPLRRKAIQALAFLPDAGTAKALTEVYAKLSAEEKVDAVATLASSPAGAVALLEAVAAERMARTTLSPFLMRQLQSLNDVKVNEAMSAVVGTMNQPKAGLAEQKAKWTTLLMPDKLTTADLKAGRLIYAAACGTCHVLNGEGAMVGPDLTGSNRGNLEYLLENVLDPNALIGRDYQLNIFTMKDGRVLSGIVKSDAGEIFKVVMPGGAEFTLNKSEVKSREVSKMSTMPEGLFDALGDDNVRNLVAYLQSGAAGGDVVSKEGLLEAEGLKSSVTKGGVGVQKMGGFKSGKWSGDAQLWWTGGKVGEVLTIEVPVKEAGRHEVKGVLTRAKDYAIFEVSVNGKVSGDPLDLFDPQVLNTAELTFGVHELKAGLNRVEFKIIGVNPQAKPSMMLGVDFLRLVKVDVKE
ncbi:cytochrome C [Phragmitibacter flavus]|uniref:Cytochrome C n=1 Tax=Phragmitibacter flavus TaxID=2576071 RepID=A0A5R8K9Z5_9BACT|nr:PVC-type heme-binding CxxCH protein [Phragmitibacter flavus]TLD69087.1 cytochrome C [Phragmitibacter flavus]